MKKKKAVFTACLAAVMLFVSGLGSALPYASGETDPLVPGEGAQYQEDAGNVDTGGYGDEGFEEQDAGGMETGGKRDDEGTAAAEGRQEWPEDFGGEAGFPPGGTGFPGGGTGAAAGQPDFPGGGTGAAAGQPDFPGGGTGAAAGQQDFPGGGTGAAAGQQGIPGGASGSGDGQTGFPGTETTSPEGRTEGTESSAEPGKEAPEDLFTPSARVNGEDLALIMGEGRDRDIDGETDAVEALLALYPDDEGLCQMAAEKSGKTAQAAEEAERAAAQGMKLGDDTLTALEHAGMAAECQAESAAAEAMPGFRIPSLFLENVYADDRQGGRSVVFEPAGDGESAMAYISSFALVRKRDGSGGWDDEASYIPEGSGYDWKGNDSNESNGVVRTGDDVTWLFAYSTALAEPYIYNTLRDTRLWVSFFLPADAGEAAFNLEAMPWIRGNGPGGGPVVREVEGGQLLTGYRELPDRTDGGESYDVPGAGTVSCVVHVNAMESGQALCPLFRTWLERSSNEGAPEDAPEPDLRVVSPEVRVTCGPWVSVTLRKPATNERRSFGTWAVMRSLYPDGEYRDKGGRIKLFPFAVRAGKPNGILKGADRIDCAKRIRVYFRVDSSSTSGEAAETGFTDLVTMSMRDASGKKAACFVSGNDYPLSVYDGVPLRYMEGAGRVTSMGVEGGRYYFDIEGFQGGEPGSLLTEGYLLMNQEQEATSEGREHLTATVTAESILASSLGSGGVEQAFSQKYVDGEGREVFPACTIESEIDSAGSWDAHMILTERWDSSARTLAGGFLSTAGVLGYGNSFGAMICQWTRFRSPDRAEKSKEWFLLWDNRKIELAEEGGKGVKEYYASQYAAKYGCAQPARYLFITKKDGSLWRSEAEMLAAELDSFRDLRFWPTCADAAAHGVICGVLCEAWGFDAPAGTEQIYDAFSVHLKPIDNPAVIGTSSLFTFGMATYRTDVKRGSSMGDASDGMGMLTPAAPGDIVKRWNMDAPRTYAKTAWDASGKVKPESIVPHNTVHEGTSLYITGSELSVTDTLMSGLEAETFDLAETGELAFRIKAGFRNTVPVRGAGAVVYTPDPVAEDGTSPLALESVGILMPDGSTRVLEEGRTYQAGDFIPGATGSFVMTRESLGELFSGSQYTGDPLDGKTYLITAGQDGELALAPSGGSSASGTPLVLARRTGDDGKLQWTFVKIQEGTYCLKHAASGLFLTVEGDSSSPGTGLALAASARENQAIQWVVEREAGGRCRLYYMKSGMAAEAGAAGLTEGAPVRLFSAADTGASWTLVRCGKGDVTGTKLEFQGLSSEYPLPELVKHYKLDKAAVTGDTRLTDTAVITGDGLKAAASSANLHMSSSSAAFVETTSSVLRIRTDKAEIENGEELTYTITYTNQGNREENVTVRDRLPSREEIPDALADAGRTAPPDMERGFGKGEQDYGSHAAYVESLSSWASRCLTTQGAGEIRLVGGSPAARTSGGSPCAISEGDGMVIAESSLKAGETLTVSYRIRTEGASSGAMIRNSAIAVKQDGTVYSNRTETAVKGIPASEGPKLLLTTGGRGRGRAAQAGALAAAALLFAWRLSRRRTLL